MDLLGAVLVRIVSAELGLNILGTLHCIDDRREVDQEAIAHRLDHMTMMVGYCLMDDLIMNCEHPQHTGFIAAHLMAKADNVGEHNSGQASGLASYCTRAVLGHSSDYRAGAEQLSNSLS